MDRGSARKCEHCGSPLQALGLVVNHLKTAFLHVGDAVKEHHERITHQRSCIEKAVLRSVSFIRWQPRRQHQLALASSNPPGSKNNVEDLSTSDEEMHVRAVPNGSAPGRVSGAVWGQSGVQGSDGPSKPAPIKEIAPYVIRNPAYQFLVPADCFLRVPAATSLCRDLSSIAVFGGSNACFPHNVASTYLCY
jgi:hypothetical protein